MQGKAREGEPEARPGKDRRREHSKIHEALSSVANHCSALEVPKAFISCVAASSCRAGSRLARQRWGRTTRRAGKASDLDEPRGCRYIERFHKEFMGTLRAKDPADVDVASIAIVKADEREANMDEDIGTIISHVFAARRGDGPTISPESVQAVGESAQAMVAHADAQVQAAAADLIAGRPGDATARLKTHAERMCGNGEIWRLLARIAFVTDPLLAVDAFTQATTVVPLDFFDKLLFARLQAWDARFDEAEANFLTIARDCPNPRLRELAKGELIELRDVRCVADESERTINNLLTRPSLGR